MNTFSRLTMFVFLGIALMLFGGTVDAQTDPFLEVVGSDGFDPGSTGGNVEVTFQAGYNGVGKPGIDLHITATNVSNITINGTPATVPGTYTTGIDGLLIVQGTAPPNVRLEIKAVWDLGGQRELNASAIKPVDDPRKGPVVIVVNPPIPDANLPDGRPKPLAVHDCFTQVITIKNEGRHPSLPLSAWQMDVVYNPLILEVVDVTEGDFLKEKGTVMTFYTEVLSPGRISVSQARPKLGDASTPPPPKSDDHDHPYSSESGQINGIVLDPTDEGTLLTIQFKLLAVSEEVLGIHNVKLQSNENYDKLPNPGPNGAPDRISYSIKVLSVAVTEEQSSAAEDVNQDGKVNVFDLVVVAGSIGMDPPDNPRADVNGDGTVNVLDLIQIYSSNYWGRGVNMITVAEANNDALTAPTANRNLSPGTIQGWIDLAQVEDDGSAIFDRGIANLEALLTAQTPSKTKLLLNYPNPFNPETWIPYQLAKASDVTVTIHATNGSLIRTLELGHQAAGIYKSKSQAAYWDGRNELGERVASGLYFYTLTAGKFSATGKMLVRK